MKTCVDCGVDVSQRAKRCHPCANKESIGRRYPARQKFSDLTDKQLTARARLILAEIGRRKGVNSTEKRVAASA